MGRPGPKPKGRVNLKWSSDLAYILGLITADGSLSKNGRHIDFTSKDIELVQTFRSGLKLEHVKIGTKSSGSSKERYYRIQFGDVLFYRWLVERGLSPNKSKTIKKVNVKKEHFFDFLRGLWDGDGTVYRSKDKRWKNSYVISVGFASGSEQFLKWVQAEINSKLVTTGHIVKSKRGTSQLRYGRADSSKIFAAMFRNKGALHLKRKFAKTKKIFRIDGLTRAKDVQVEELVDSQA